MTRAVRIVHFGVGSFARSHQAWYTASTGGDWGIAGHRGRVLGALARQGYRYGMIVRGPETDSVTALDSIVATADVASLANPEVALVTLTITEAGYRPGEPVPAELVDGLRQRRSAGAGPIAIVPCDNLPSNGRVIREAILALAEPELASWIDDSVSFVSTMVDRITPATTEADRAIASEALGWPDSVPVVTEPFTEWVLQGSFPGGRPAWENAGAEFVDDVTPYEDRKLWMLNGAHSLLAYRGLELGCQTVFEAYADPGLRAEVEQLWGEAREVLALDAASVDAWLAALRIRWANPRLEHRLEQIALGGEQKIAARIFTVDEARRRAGLPIGTAGVETVAAWRRYEQRR
jgi:fructuronate reductase